MHSSVMPKLKELLKEYEGKINHMYLDKKGLVTVGVGHKIDPIQDALKMQFRTKGGGSIVSEAEIQAEWHTVKARKDLINTVGEFAKITRLELSDKGIEAMIERHARAIETYIKTNAAARKFYANFDNWPADAQLGFLGLAWGGVPLPQFGWHKFPAACKAEDWLTAAKESRIKTNIPEGRNRAHKLAFENAAKVKADGHDIKTIYWPGILLRQVNIPV